MARRPFFGQGPAPQIARMNMEAATAPGRAYAAAFQKLGDIASDTLEKFREKKEEKEREDNFERMAKKLPSEVFSAFGVQSEEEKSDFIKSIKKKGPREDAMAVMSFYQKAQDAQDARDVRDLQMQQLRKNMERQKDADLLAEQARQKEEAQAQIYDQFLSGREMVDMQLGRTDTNPLMRNVPGPTTQVPQGEYKGNRFFQTEQGKSDFTSLVDAGMDASDALEMASKREAQLLASQKPQKIARTITVQDGQGGFTQVGVDEFGNPVRNFGPAKPSGMYPTPEEKTEEIILVGRTKDAMETVKNTVNESNLAIKQAEQAELALTNLPETTGGITSFINDMKVLAESVGIDLPKEYQEDMKDIGVFRQVTGQFLFNAMQNTKGSITENEMKLFRRISPDIDNSRAANEAMLKLYIKAGQRAKGRRDLIRSLQEQQVNPVLIQKQIEKFDEENSLMGDIQALAPNSTTKTKFNFNGQNIDVEIVGERKDGTPIYKDKKTGQILVQQPAQ